MSTPEFNATDACKTCKGACCKNMGCHFSPSDFGEITFEGLKAEIEKGFISIDWWESESREYFLRIRNKNAPVVDPSWGGECMLLTEKGCPLPFEKRPLGARALRPKDSAGKCVSFYSKEQCKNDWAKYYDILQRLVTCFQQDETLFIL